MHKLLALLLGCIVLSQVSAAQEKQIDNHHRRTGIGITFSTLGAGIEIAAPLTTRSNLRTAFNMFRYSRPFDTNGITYSGELDLRSAQLMYDWFPFANAFHLSPGIVVYNGNRITAQLSVPAGKRFDLGHNTYLSDPKDPIRGNATITFRKIAPSFLFGWGNLIPRKHHRFTVPVEFGLVFHGEPKLSFDLGGKGCDGGHHVCKAINKDPEGIRDTATERAKINHTLSRFRFYPILSIGFAYNF